MTACQSSVVRCPGLPWSDHRTGHGGELLEARAALGTVGVPVGAQGGDALRIVQWQYLEMFPLTLNDTTICSTAYTIV